jgi:hypothetical protein
MEQLFVKNRSQKPGTHTNTKHITQQFLSNPTDSNNTTHRTEKTKHGR